jgi:hypothetical protein
VIQLMRSATLAAWAGGIAILLVLASSVLVPSFSLLGKGAPYPISNGFPIGFYYALGPHRTIFLLLPAILDFLVWYLFSAVLVLAYRKRRLLSNRRMRVFFQDRWHLNRGDWRTAILITSTLALVLLISSVGVWRSGLILGGTAIVTAVVVLLASELLIRRQRRRSRRRQTQARLKY